MTIASLKSQIKNSARILKQIFLNKEFSLIPYISAIDPDFYTAPAPQSDSCRTRDPHPLFDSEYYRHIYLPENYSGHPFVHYLKEGVKAGNRPGPFYDEDTFVNNYPAQVAAGLDPLRAYLKIEKHKRRDTGLLFNQQWYLVTAAGLDTTIMDAISHYRIHGFREGKSPTPLFHSNAYQKAVGSIAPDQDPFTHYLLNVSTVSSEQCPTFDPAYYVTKYGHTLDHCTPAEHYLKCGHGKAYYANGTVENLPEKPLISIVVPVYNTKPEFLNYCIRSVLNQSYPNWQLCLADDGSSRAGMQEQLKAWERYDRRIQVTFHETNKGISAATNTAATLAKGSYLGFLDNDDELAPHCLYLVAKNIVEHQADILYTDEDLIGEHGERLSIFRKPDFNRELLHSHNYITHFTVTSAELFKKSGGFRSECDGAQDFDLLLRLSLLTDKIIHIPEILYHWRASETSTSINHDQKSYAHDAGKTALQDYLDQAGIEGTVHDTDLNFYYRIKRHLPAEPEVTVLLWNDIKDNIAPEVTCSNLRQATGYRNYTFMPFERHDQEKECGLYQSLHTIIIDSKSKYIALLNESARRMNGTWLTELVSIAEQDNIAMTCGKIRYPAGDGPSYTTPNINNLSAHYYRDYLQFHQIHLHGIHCPQEICIPAPHVCLISREFYLEAGGFDYANFPAVLGLADLGLKAMTMGKKCVYTPYSSLELPAPCSKVEDEALGQHEQQAFQDKWSNHLSTIQSIFNAGSVQDAGIELEDYERWLAGS
ncbi:glycosyltransferase [Desulfopila sp. IMCC35008]|uniref:glycosyltransferase family 2 protein n=1 Tax=Desulfopila sp. IMCC35008 TaxID=2653858 RepID=UPI0013D88FD1|nr:glycosyltransferase [Desulfopila sp. IMCC35008]